ncbi:MAG: hypothetical protein M3Y87_03975, partial [Myxococcota bacterium]|nr:hypothetical protein [Myxococcota bacterium]
MREPTAIRPSPSTWCRRALVLFVGAIAALGCATGTSDLHERNGDGAIARMDGGTTATTELGRDAAPFPP